MKRQILATVVGLLACAGSPAFAVEQRPNVIVIVTDDQGFSDAGFQGCREIPTPHIDALAQSGVIFDAGYVTHPYCSPSRAGLLSGRYQQRFGHECNPNGKEIDDLASTRPEKAKQLADMIKKWDAENIAPIWLDPHGPNVRKEEAARTQAVNAASQGEKK
ncbi:sulfatase family protein [Blastopirellula retiformator]|uniref:Arylsulfatase n=1 Tax=Blastopirellula retiformator TaxID=2527970 RepID=A0A5C5V513_9BACT|nr:sulfatase-like hydrolase/transferase [Blastopirellula retiformator]TWT33421.1 Arylsulfatase precursor [Blastopirellula retiformator]